MKKGFAFISFLILLLCFSSCGNQGEAPLTKSVPIRELIIQRVATKDQPTLTAHIFSVATNERFYNTLSSLPQVPSSTLARPTPAPEYQLTFKTAQDVPALVYSKEGLIRFDTDYWLTITDQFEKAFKEILAQAKIATVDRPSPTVGSIAQWRL